MIKGAPLERTTRLKKVAADVRVGISFQKDSAPMHIGEDTDAYRQGMLPPVVRAVHPSGLAAAAGLSVGDMVVSINGVETISNLNAASMLRKAVGDLEIRYIPRSHVLGHHADPTPSGRASKGSAVPPQPQVAPLDIGSVLTSPPANEPTNGGDFTSRFFKEANRCVARVGG
jgi:membrane-associated protease RseP (regulator of RpoE activity)